MNENSEIEEYWADRPRVKLPVEVPSIPGNPNGFVILRILNPIWENNVAVVGGGNYQEPVEKIVSFLKSSILDNEGRCPDYDTTRRHFLELEQSTNDTVNFLDRIVYGYTYPYTVKGSSIQEVLRSLYDSRSMDDHEADRVIYNFIEEYFTTNEEYPEVSLIMGYLHGAIPNHSQLRGRLRELIVMAGGKFDT